LQLNASIQLILITFIYETKPISMVLKSSSHRVEHGRLNTFNLSKHTNKQTRISYL